MKKKCLIKLTWKSLEGSRKLKARMPVPHSIWQSSRSPLATNAGLSLQRDVQPFHFASCHHGSRGINLGATVPTATLWTGVCPSGDSISAEEGKQGKPAIFRCWSLAAWQRTACCRSVSCSEGFGGPLCYVPLGLKHFILVSKRIYIGHLNSFKSSEVLMFPVFMAVWCGGISRGR